MEQAKMNGFSIKTNEETETNHTNGFTSDKSREFNTLVFYVNGKEVDLQF